MNRISIQEKDRTLTLKPYIQKNLMSEQKWISKILGPNADDVIKVFDDTAIKTMDDLFSKVFTKSGNVVQKNTGAYLVSNGGKEYPINLIKELIDLVAKGKLKSSEVLERLPTHLKDGTEFRNVMKKAFESETKKTAGLVMRPKQVYGRGIEHQIFTSSSNPNVLFKVGHKDVIDEWLDVFKSNTEIFPKTFRTGKTKEKDMFYVEIEKLDTKKFEKDWDNLEMALEDIGVLDVDGGQSFSDLYINEGSSAQIFVEIGKKLQKYNKTSYKFFIDFLTVIKKAERSIKKIKKKTTIVDAHKYNFGYGSDGKIKCLDL